MKSLILVVFACMTISGSAFAQCPSNNCPPDDGNGCWYEANSLWTLYSGCQIDVDYCFREVTVGSSITYEYIIDYVQVESGCRDMTLDQLMGAVAGQLYQSISSLPLCGGPLNGTVVAVSANNCWKYDPNPIHFPGSPLGIGGYLQCGSGLCTKTCSICFGYNPACECYQEQISDCSYASDYSDGCIEEAVDIFEMTPLACYHLPCGDW